MIKLILITNDVKLAHQAQQAGVGRIFVDLELLGKQQRQGHLDTHITSHSMQDIAPVKSVLDKAELMVRVNPLHDNTHREVDEAIREGADILMLPMYRNAEEVSEFARMVDHRVRIIPLLENAGAAESVEAVAHNPAIAEIYIGLNDLHLDLGLQFIFEPLASGLVDELAAVIKNAGLAFGFGGIARVGDGIIPGELVLAEHLRLGSSSVILSRTFQKLADRAFARPGSYLIEEIQKLENAFENLVLRDPKQVDADSRRLRELVNAVIERKANEASV